MKKILVFALFTLLPLTASANSGTCGENCSWKIENDVLTVYPTTPGQAVVMDAYSPVETGEGDGAYKSRTSAPWGDSYQTIKGVVVSEGIDTISDRAFQGLRNVTSVSMPNTLTTIGLLSFDRMTSLTTVDIPDSVTTIGRSAFQYATSLENLTIGNSVQTIEQNAFSNAQSLTSLNIPDSVTSIGPYAFRNTTSLENVNIPGSVESIGDFAFRNAYALTNINFQEGLKTIGNSAFEATSLTSVTLPDSVLSIGKYAFGQAFAYNDYLTGRIDTIILGENIQEIGAVAFSRNTATSLVLPESLFADGRQLNPFAFEYSNIATIYCPEGYQSCLDFVPMHCTGDIDTDGKTCLGEMVPSSVQLTILTYKKESDGSYRVGAKEYDTFDDLQSGNEHDHSIPNNPIFGTTSGRHPYAVGSKTLPSAS